MMMMMMMMMIMNIDLHPKKFLNPPILPVHLSMLIYQKTRSPEAGGRLGFRD